MPPVLAVDKLSKRFGGTLALDQVSLEIEPGEIRALIGENGAGKSTLVKTLGGFHTPDEGTIRLGGVDLGGRTDTQNRGVTIVHQDLALVDEMTVWESIGIGAHYDRHGVAPLSVRHERQVAVRLLGRFGQTFDANAKIRDLRQSERSMVAILRAIRKMEAYGRERSLLILDEPTASLYGGEVERLLQFVRDIAKDGCAVIIVEHHLQHVLDVADTVTILRSGRLIGTYPVASLGISDLVRLMLGYDVSAERLADSARDAAAGRTGVGLEVSHLSGQQIFDISFAVRPGEVVGFTGLGGMGQEELPYLLAGGVARTGSVRVDGQPVADSIADSLSKGLVIVPDRRAGIWRDGTAAENITLPVLSEVGSKFLMSARRQTRRAAELMKEFDVNPPNPHYKMSAFSGGNQQKILLAKWMQTNPRVLVFDSPTKGVDAGGRLAVLHLLRRAAADCAVVLSSEDAEELVQVCDRIVILNEGKISVTLEGDDLSVSKILALREIRLTNA